MYGDSIHFLLNKNFPLELHLEGSNSNGEIIILVFLFQKGKPVNSNLIRQLYLEETNFSIGTKNSTKIEL